MTGEKQKVEKMTYNCEAGCCYDRLASSQGADQVFEPWAMVLLQSAHLTMTSFRYTGLGMAALSHLNSHSGLQIG